MRLPDSYRPPFVTETDEPVWDDCVPCSIVMLVAAWTLGETTDLPTGPTMSRVRLKRLRERMRDRLPRALQGGGLRPEHAVAMVAAQWPFLPPLLTPKPTWDSLWDQLRTGSAAALWGNPAEVRKPDSPLRRWTANDDFGHCLFVLRATATDAWVMDPLGRGAYKGQWVRAGQLKRYAYLDGERVRSCAVVTIGAQREAAVHARAIRARLLGRIDDLKAQIRPIEQVAAEARAQALAEARSAIEALEDTP